MVADNFDKYKAADNLDKYKAAVQVKREKEKIALFIVMSIRFNGAGQFLEEDPKSGNYYDVGNLRAITKKIQALSDEYKKEGKKSAPEETKVSAPKKNNKSKQASFPKSSNTPPTQQQQAIEDVSGTAMNWSLGNSHQMGVFPVVRTSQHIQDIMVAPRIHLRIHLLICTHSRHLDIMGIHLIICMHNRCMHNRHLDITIMDIILSLIKVIIHRLKAIHDDETFVTIMIQIWY